MGLAFAAGSVVLAILIPALSGSAFSDASSLRLWRIRVVFPIHALSPAGGGFVVGVVTVALCAVAHELAMRGFAASRFRMVTQSTLGAGLAALAMDLLANLPLWGLAYTAATAAVEVLLLGLFLWKRRLLPCIVANFALGMVLLLAAPNPAASDNALAHVSRAPKSSPAGKAIENLNRALNSAGPADAFVKAATEYAKRRDYDKAEAEMGKAIAAQPKVPEFYIYRGDLYSAQNRHDLAIADYSSALALVPDEAALYRRRANEYIKADNDQAAHRDFAKSIALRPDDASTYIDRSALYVREERYEEAVRDIGEALKLDPNRSDYLYRRAGVLQLMHQYDRAIHDCNRMIAINSSLPDGYLCRAQEEMVKGDRAQAIGDLGEVLKRAPDNQAALTTRADLEIQLERWSAARVDLVALAHVNAIDAETADWAAHELATSVYPELRDGPAAVALATRACEATAFKDVKYLETLASAYAESGDFAKAVQWQERATSTASDPQEVRFLRWQLAQYRKGIPYREDDSGPVTHRTFARTIFAVVASVLALVGFVTVLVMFVRFVAGRFQRPSAPVAATGQKSAAER
jgi:tetratricopeptide (TPR) repeat protein